MTQTKRNKPVKSAARVSLPGLTLCLAMSALPAHSQSSPGNAQPNPQCATIADPAARLACYDKTNSTGKGVETAHPDHWPEFTGAPPPTTRAAPPADPVARTSPALPRNRSLVAGVNSFNFSTSKRFTVILDNGQTWRQLDADNDVAQFRDHGPNRVVISHGFLRSYDLRLNDMSAIFKVERVK